MMGADEATPGRVVREHRDLVRAALLRHEGHEQRVVGSTTGGSRTGSALPSTAEPQEARMRTKRLSSNLGVADLAAAKGFYPDFVGLWT